MNNTRHFIFEKRGDYLVWSANNREVDAGNVAEVVDQYRNSERELTIYSGTHGDPGGNFSGVGYAEREFAYEDRENLPGNVKVVNVGRNKIDVKKTIDEATTDSFSGGALAIVRKLVNRPIRAKGVRSVRGSDVTMSCDAGR